MTDNKKTSTGMPSFNLASFILACLRGNHSRRVWLSTWLRLSTPPRFSVSVKRNLRVPMAGGVYLMTDHYSPNTSSSTPTILIRSIWGRAWYELPSGPLYSLIAQRFAERGYHVILQTVRATSPTNILTANETTDGQATIDWIARQPWFQGQLGMWGLSYLGFVQWAVVKEDAPFLQALVPGITTSWFRALFYQDDAFALQAVLVVFANLALAQIPLWKLFSALNKQKS